MTRTVTALYQDRVAADAAWNRLKAAGLGDRVDLHDEASASDSTHHDGEGFVDSLRRLFGGHRDTHTYAEGVRRGHILLTAKIDDLRATEAAELLDATSAVDLHAAEATWKSEGWASPATDSPVGSTASAIAGEVNAGTSLGGATAGYTPGARARSYWSGESAGAAETAGEGVVGGDTLIRGTERQSGVDIGDVNTPAPGAGFGTSRPV